MVYQNLLSLLARIGEQAGGTGTEIGFPINLPLESGTVTLHLPAPGLLGVMDPDEVGIAVIDSDGQVRTLWGVARRCPSLKLGVNCFTTELGFMLNGAMKGATTNLYHDGLRYFAAGIPVGDKPGAILLVTSAEDERLAKKEAAQHAKAAGCLKRLGKALTMNQGLQELCVSVVHEVASSTELAAALLWTLDPEDESLKLRASVGVNRNGTQTLHRLDAGYGSCAAELVAAGEQTFFLSNVYDHLMTSDLEAQICYLKPGGVSIHPLIISEKVLGVLELIGRENDPDFADQQDLFCTISEHLALALNSAILFENFEKMATHDALTGLANHRTMQEFLQRRIAEAQRTGNPVGALMLDVDHFRSFNEEEGHDAGDEVLRLVVDALRSSIRPYDLAARYGGEEFTVILPGSDRKQTLTAAERIRRKVEMIPFVTRTGRERHVTISIGCADFPNTSLDSGSVLRAADMALFEAKRAGRNRCMYFEGAYVHQQRQDDLDMEKVWRWVPYDRVEAVKAAIESARHYLEPLAKALRLSPSQQQILQALLIVSSTYLDASESGNEVLLAKMNAADEFRLLLPSLQALDERYDGRGTNATVGARIPLLGRVLAVVLAIVNERSRPLIEDPGRFDPEIVALVTELGNAA